MSSIKIESNSSGAGLFTIVSPNSNTNRTLTLPDATGTIITTAGGAAISGTTGDFSSTIKGGSTISVGGATPAASGAGITFPATASASSDANTLDDYEEGTWTPSIGGNATYTAQTGTYTKIGRLVTIQGDITINVIGTGSIYTISGLPFTAGAQQWGSVGGFTGLNTGNIVFISCYVDSGATNLSFNGLSAAGVTSGLLAPFKNGAQIAFSISYYF